MTRALTVHPEDPVPAVSVLRPDLARIADWIGFGSNVLDLGCGDGALLAHLQSAKNCTGYGVEIDAAEVLACVRRGVDVVQRNIEDGLGMFSGGRFDVCVLSMAIQATHQTEQVVREMSRIASVGIVSFPNFGHWYHLWSIMRGRMPITRQMPYQWYNTPNLHLTTIRDFELLLSLLNLDIEERVFLDEGREVRSLVSKRATQAIYRFRRH
jgi:methionine biosynthesis protein MetW